MSKFEETEGEVLMSLEGGLIPVILHLHVWHEFYPLDTFASYKSFLFFASSSCVCLCVCSQLDYNHISCIEDGAFRALRDLEVL